MTAFIVTTSTKKINRRKRFKLNTPIQGQSIDIPSLSDDELYVLAYENGILKLQNPHVTYICQEI